MGVGFCCWTEHWGLFVLKVLDCFAGIGGFSIGLERAGFETVAFCEIEPYCQKVLAKHWPGVPIYDDIRQVTADRLFRDGIRPDVITGGFPCQDISTAGRQAGIEGERSGLWTEIARLISELQPRYAIMENVTNLISGDSGRWFGRVLGDLAEIGYDAEWHCIPASAIGAHHHRDRVWIVAYPNGDSQPGRAINAGKVHPSALLAHTRERKELITGVCQDMADPSGKGLQGGPEAGNNGKDRKEPRNQLITGLSGVQGGIWATEPNVGRVANGIPARSHRLKALGNAVVPQIPEIIGNAIMEAERERVLASQKQAGA